MTASAGSESQVAEPLELRLAREQRAPGQARAAVGRWCEPLGLPAARVQAVVLLVSELVSNAVVHAKAPSDSAITLEARLEGPVLRIDVSDAGPGFQPRPRNPAQLSDGYGLFLLDKLASRWGVAGGSATNVWFELPLGAGG